MAQQRRNGKRAGCNVDGDQQHSQRMFIDYQRSADAYMDDRMMKLVDELQMDSSPEKPPESQASPSAVDYGARPKEVTGAGKRKQVNKHVQHVSQTHTYADYEPTVHDDRVLVDHFNLLQKFHRMSLENQMAANVLGDMEENVVMKWRDTNHRMYRTTSLNCVFCKKNGEMPIVYKSHCTKDDSGLVTCPILKRHVCTECGATGEYAHTKRYCTERPKRENLPSMRLLANGVITDRKYHK